MSDSVEKPPEDSGHGESVRAAWIAGAETFDRYAQVLRPLAIGLMDELVDVTIFCPDTADSRSLESLPSGAVSYQPPRWYRTGGRTMEPLAGEIRKRKVDLLHALDATAAELTGRLARLLGLPYLLSAYSTAEALRLRAWSPGAAGVLAASEPIRHALADREIGAADQVHLMRPGVYHVRRAACFHDPEHRPAIIAGGPMNDLPAFDAVLRCFAELAARKADCVFFLVGGGPCERRLRARSEELELDHDLSFVECRPMGQLAGVLKAGDLYISPSSADGFDIRSLLAMAAGVPVLAAAGDVENDFLRDGQTAIFFRPGDAGELTVKLDSLLDDHPAARALAEHALEYIHANHSPAANVAGLSALYRQALCAPADRE